MNEWKSFCLGDVCNICSSKRIFAREYTKQGIPFYRGKEIIEKHNKNKVSNTLYISEKRYLEVKSKYDVPKIGDILLTSVGTLGIAWFIDESNFYFKDGNLTWLRASDLIDSKFLYWWLNSKEAQEQIERKCIGTTQKALTIETLNKFTIFLPPLDTQKKIAAVLSALDDKIELNNAINKNLEEQLNRVYDKIFQSTKKIIELGAVIKTTSGGTPSRKNSSFYKDGQICWVKSKELSGKYIIDTEEKINEIALKNSSAKILPEHSVLIAMYGATVGEYGIISKPMTCNQAVCALIANEQYPFSYLYQIAKESKSYFLNMAVGSAQQNISQILIKQLPVHDDILRIKKFHSFAAPIHGILKNLQTENKKLGEIRDALLPRLMSGEIDVSAVEI